MLPPCGAASGHFYPRPPRGGRLIDSGDQTDSVYISIHALREEGDRSRNLRCCRTDNFYPRPPRGGRLAFITPDTGQSKFLSTPSARRATRIARAIAEVLLDFYPRPPRGGRLSVHRRAHWVWYFYPRPPRGGRLDSVIIIYRSAIFLSTPSARRATALKKKKRRASPFLSTPSARRATTRLHSATASPLLFLSTPSARRATQFYIDTSSSSTEFLSTPSARRATAPDRWNILATWYFYPRPPRGGRRRSLAKVAICRVISIHALREEGDRSTGCVTVIVSDFYPRPPRGGRQQKQRENPLLLSHYTPLCTNCKEMLAKQTAKSHRYLRKRLVFRCEASRKTMCAAGSHWPGIKRSARCLVQTPGAVQRARPSSDSCCPAGRTVDCPRQGRSGRSALL